jgi:uncharacterized phage protein gp47/JayE
MNQLALEAFPWTAEDTAEDWGALFYTPRKQASFAGGSVDLTGSEGVSVPANSIVQVGSIRYRVKSSAPVSGGVVSPPVVALESGVVGNAGAGDAVTLVTAVSGIDAAGVVSSGGLTGGADQEDLVSYRNRYVSSLRKPSGGGSEDDYVRWAKEVPGVTRAWVTSHGNGEGTVVIRFMMDAAYEDGIPQAADEQAVLDYLRRHWDEDVGRYVGYPVEMEGHVYAWACVAKPMTWVIADLDPSTDEVKAAIEAQLKDMIRREAEPGKTIMRAWSWEAISLATGETSHVLTTPDGPFVTEIGEIATYGGVSYVTT